MCSADEEVHIAEEGVGTGVDGWQIIDDELEELLGQVRSVRALTRENRRSQNVRATVAIAPWDETPPPG
jgi:hypothetical protein